jgi:hypothetical protein
MFLMTPNIAQASLENLGTFYQITFLKFLKPGLLARIYSPIYSDTYHYQQPANNGLCFQNT